MEETARELILVLLQLHKLNSEIFFPEYFFEDELFFNIYCCHLGELKYGADQT